MLLLALIGITGCYWYQSYILKTHKTTIPSTPTVLIKPTVTGVPPDETANWKTYTSKDSGITFKYPVQITEMLPTEAGVGGPILGNPVDIVTFADRTTTHKGTDAPFDGFTISQIEVGKLSEPQMTFEVYIEKELEAVKKAPRGNSLASVAKASIGSQDFVYIDLGAVDKIRNYYIILPDSERIVVFSRTYSTIDFLTVFDQILSTFRFTN